MEHKNRTYKKVNLPGLLDYFISIDGEILSLRKEIIKYTKFIKQINENYRSGKRQGYKEKHPSAFLRFKDKTVDKIKIHKLILIAYRGNRGPEYRADFIDENGPLHLSNLTWNIRENIELFKLLSDEEFILWSKKTDTIAKEDLEKFNSYVTREYLRVSYRLWNYPQKKKRFFKTIFDLKFKGWQKNEKIKIQ